MSVSELQDSFSSILAKLELLLEVWGELSTTEAKEVGVGCLVIQGVKALTSDYMYTPYSLTFEALERLSAFREQITNFDIQDECLEGSVEALVVAMIEQRAASQLMYRDNSISTDPVLWEDGAFNAVESMADDETNSGVIFRKESQYLEELRPSQSAVEDVDGSLTPGESAGYGRFFQEKNEELKATVDNLNREIKDLNLANQKLKVAVKVADKQLGELRLLQEETSNLNTTLMEELQGFQNLHVVTCNEKNELKAEKATLRKRFALSKRTLQGTVRKLKSEIEVLQLTLPSKAATIDSDWEVRDKSFQSDALKTKELLAEAEEDLATIRKSHNQLITEHDALQDSHSTLLRDKAAIAEGWEQLKFENADLEDTVAQSHHMLDWLRRHSDKLVERDSTCEKAKEELASANERLVGSLSKDKDESATLFKSIEKLEADSVKKEIELNQAADLVSRLMDERERSKAGEALLLDEGDRYREEKALLMFEKEKYRAEKALPEEHLTETIKSLDLATTTITASNMHVLTAENLQLEHELEAANAIINQIRSTILPPSTPRSKAQEPSTNHGFPDTPVGGMVDLNEDFEWPNEGPMDPYRMGDIESDTWSTMLTPRSALDGHESCYFGSTDRYDAARM